jgi:hypothetical protein
VRRTWAANYVDLIKEHRDEAGWFRCDCGERGHIFKSSPAQEPGHIWERYELGIIPLGDPGNSYQPYVVLIGDTPEEADQVQFAYYKDLRDSGGKLKTGHGPGGPPVLAITQLDNLIEKLRSLGDGAG